MLARRGVSSRVVPFLHLDLPLDLGPGDRRRIAARLARLYADVMETQPGRVTVAFRALGEAGVLRLGEPVVMVQADIRRGRPPAQRERLGAGIAALLDEELGWPPARTVVEFTQHPGDEVWRVDGLGTDWSPAEAAEDVSAGRTGPRA
jgi:phenylpyruvate tautomerase PptA (4-oxalocrotonate tautomerase family)